jgi:hypothetical protein
LAGVFTFVDIPTRIAAVDVTTAVKPWRKPIWSLPYVMQTDMEWKRSVNLS